MKRRNYYQVHKNKMPKGKKYKQLFYIDLEIKSEAFIEYVDREYKELISSLCPN